MKKAIALALFISACGYSSKANELVGQVKKVVARTPIICPDYFEVDVSLGLLRNGMGSLSKEDVVLYVENDSDVPLLKLAAEEGFAVKVGYDIRRMVFCVESNHWMTSVRRLGPIPAAVPEAPTVSMQ